MFLLDNTQVIVAMRPIGIFMYSYLIVKIEFKLKFSGKK